MYTKKNINDKKKKVVRRTSVAMQQMNNIFKNQLNNKDSGIIDTFIKEREKNRKKTNFIMFNQFQRKNIRKFKYNSNIKPNIIR